MGERTGKGAKRREKGDIRGGLFDVQGCTNAWPAQEARLGQSLGYLLLAETKEGNLPRVSHPQVMYSARLKGAHSEFPRARE